MKNIRFRKSTLFQRENKDNKCQSQLVQVLLPMIQGCRIKRLIFQLWEVKKEVPWLINLEFLLQGLIEHNKLGYKNSCQSFLLEKGISSSNKNKVQDGRLKFLVQEVMKNLKVKVLLVEKCLKLVFPNISIKEF